MDQKQIDRLNELAKKAKSPEGLTQWEADERAALRREYTASGSGIWNGYDDKDLLRNHSTPYGGSFHPYTMA